MINKLIAKRINRKFDENDAVIVKEMLLEYGPEPHHREAIRVHGTILDLAGKDVAKVRQLVDLAKIDYRDLLAASRLPKEWNTSHLIIGIVIVLYAIITFLKSYEIKF